MSARLQEGMARLSSLSLVLGLVTLLFLLSTVISQEDKKTIDCRNAMEISSKLCGDSQNDSQEMKTTPPPEEPRAGGNFVTCRRKEKEYECRWKEMCRQCARVVVYTVGDGLRTEIQNALDNSACWGAKVEPFECLEEYEDGREYPPMEALNEMKPWLMYTLLGIQAFGIAILVTIGLAICLRRGRKRSGGRHKKKKKVVSESTSKTSESKDKSHGNTKGKKRPKAKVPSKTKTNSKTKPAKAKK